MKKRSLAFAFLAFAQIMGGGVTAASAKPRYQVTDLGGLHGGASEAVAINASGEVVGNADTPQFDDTTPRDYFTHAFFWKHGHFYDLGTMGAKGSHAVGLNNRGQVLIDINPVFPEDVDDCFLWQRGVKHRLKYGAVCINNLGHIVGWYRNGLFLIRGKHRYRMGDRLKRDGGVFGYDFEQAYAINDRDQVIFHLQNSGDEYVAVWTNGKLRDLNRGPSTESIPSPSVHAINRPGEVVGQVNIAVVWQGSQYHKLKEPEEIEYGTEAFGINDRGSIVGSMEAMKKFGQLDERAVLWRNSKVYNLNLCIPKRCSWILKRAVGINNRGQIIGNGVHNGKKRAFLLTPEAN